MYLEFVLDKTQIYRNYVIDFEPGKKIAICSDHAGYELLKFTAEDT